VQAREMSGATGIAVYLVKNLDALPRETINYWAGINFKTLLLSKCFLSKEIEKCISASLYEHQTNFSQYRKLVLVTDIKSREYFNILANLNISKKLSLVIAFRPGKDTLSESKFKNLSVPLVVLVGTTDKRDIILDSMSTASSLRAQGRMVWSTWLTPYPEGSNGKITITSPQVVVLTSNALGINKNNHYHEFLSAERMWQYPSLSNQEYFTHVEYNSTRPVNSELINVLAGFYFQSSHYLNQLPLQSYAAFDVLGYLKHSSTKNSNKYLVFKNRKGRYFVIDLEIYGKFKPIIVIGLDHIKNLYTLTKFYRTKRSYSWLDDIEPRPLFVESLGPFLFFEKPLPNHLKLPLWQYGQILLDTIELKNNNPLKKFDNLQLELKDTINNNCVSCHKIFGTGGRAHHIDAFTGEELPGFGLALELYDRNVMKRFLFNQNEVAGEIGVIPNPVSNGVAVEMLDYLYQ
jgi:hypothetical protein